jgi:hypothetical protein
LEVLIAIGVGVLLIALLLPALATARKHAYTVRCLGNQRQLLAAIRVYAMANHDFVMFTGWAGGGKQPNWLYNAADPGVGAPPTVFATQFLHTGLMWPYLRSETLFRCPLDDTTWSNASLQFITSYVMNGGFCSYGSAHIRVTQCHSDDVVFWELPAYATANRISVNDPSNYPPEGVTLRHFNSTTVGYLDGRAELMVDSEFNAECQSGPSHLWCDPSVTDGGFSKYTPVAQSNSDVLLILRFSRMRSLSWAKQFTDFIRLSTNCDLDCKDTKRVCVAHSIARLQRWGLSGLRALIERTNSFRTALAALLAERVPLATARSRSDNRAAHEVLKPRLPEFSGSEIR